MPEMEKQQILPIRLSLTTLLGRLQIRAFNRSYKRNLSRYNGLSKRARRTCSSHNMQSIITLHDLVRDYLSIKKIIVYGGYAINALLPKKYRLYDEYDMPDVDCYVLSCLEPYQRNPEYFEDAWYSHNNEERIT